MRTINLTTMILLPALLLLLPEVFSYAQNTSPEYGLASSPRGIGLALMTQKSPAYFNSYSLVADLNGVLSGKRPFPGLKGTYVYDVILKEFTVENDVSACFYAGPGLVAGYVRDTDKPFGVVSGLAGNTGVRFDFKRGVSILAECQADIAVYLSRNQRYGNIDLTLYNAGVVRSFYPHIKIMFKL